VKKRKETINFSRFCDGFTGDYKNNFSYEGKKALFDYLEGYEEETDEELEFDPIALCCDYNEYKDLKEFQSNYGKEYESLEDIEAKTQVIKLNNGGFIIQVF
jgi:hypothetical protein